MKVSNKLMYSAIARTLLNLYDAEGLGNEVVKLLNNDKSGAVELQTSRANGFVLRVRKDLSLTDKNLQKVLADATSNLLSDKEDEAVDYMSDTFDLVFDKKYISASYAQEIFEISKNGRLVYVDADI